VTRSQLQLVTRPPQSVDAPSVRLVNVRELAAAVGCSERQAYRIGTRVPHYRVGRMLRFDLAEVLAVLREEPGLGRW
jgi:hypothetical protein